MSINLSKGQGINLTKEAPGLKHAWIGLGWDINASSGTDFDLDASTFMLGGAGKLPNEKYFVFYNNTESPDSSVKYLGDNRTGEGSGDDETVEIDLNQVDPLINEIIFVVTIHEADKRGQNFGQVSNSFIRIVDSMTEQEVAKYQLAEQFSTETAIEFGRLYRQSGEWLFQAIGNGYQAGLDTFVNKYFS
ncbi:MAG: TerD family protein [Chroococcales cyanobacterium]